MLATTHSLLGAAIVSSIPNLSFSLPLSFLSHFVLDSFPHSQPALKPWKITRNVVVLGLLDLLLAVSIVSLLSFSFDKPNLLLGSLFSCLPDVDIILYINSLRKYLKSKWLKPWTKFHESIQNETNSFYGSLTQIIIIFLSLIVIYKYAGTS